MKKTYQSAKYLIHGPVMLLVLFVINCMTTPGFWWVKWAALGIGITWVFSLLRVVRAAVLVGGLAAVVAMLRRGKHDWH